MWVAEAPSALGRPLKRRTRTRTGASRLGARRPLTRLRMCVGLFARTAPACVSRVAPHRTELSNFPSFRPVRHPRRLKFSRSFTTLRSCGSTSTTSVRLAAPPRPWDHPSPKGAPGMPTRPARACARGTRPSPRSPLSHSLSPASAAPAPGNRCDRVFLVMELLEGGELLEALLARGNYSEADTRVIFKQARVRGCSSTHRAERASQSPFIPSRGARLPPMGTSRPSPAAERSPSGERGFLSAALRISHRQPRRLRCGRAALSSAAVFPAPAAAPSADLILISCPPFRVRPLPNGQILDGLEYVHSMGIVHRRAKTQLNRALFHPPWPVFPPRPASPSNHISITTQSFSIRDVKLENLMLGSPGDLNSIRLIDFGLARTLDRAMPTGARCAENEIRSRVPFVRGGPQRVWLLRRRPFCCASLAGDGTQALPTTPRPPNSATPRPPPLSLTSREGPHLRHSELPGARSYSGGPLHTCGGLLGGGCDSLHLAVWVRLPR